MEINQAQEKCTIRFAQVKDASEIIRMIKELAEYERDPDAAVAKLADIEAQMESARPPFECILAEVDNRIVGFDVY